MLSKKSPSHRFAKFAVVAALVFFLGSCQDEKKQDADKEKAGSSLVGQQPITVQMNCVKLTKQQIQVWVDSGWTNPANPGTLIRRILLQFYSADATGLDANMQLMSYPGTSYTNVYVGGKTNLEIDTSCSPMTLTGPVVLANNFVNFKDLKITNADGTLNDFTFIRFKPIKTHPPYLNFEVEVVRVVGAQEQIISTEGSDPCPPYCPDDGDGLSGQ